MGTYIYGITQKKINVDGEDIHLCKFMFKPWWGWEHDRPILKARIARIENGWIGKEIKLIVVGDKFEEGSEIYDFSKRMNYEGDILCAAPVFHDDPFGFGKVVGWLKKEGRTWHRSLVDPAKKELDKIEAVL